VLVAGDGVMVACDGVMVTGEPLWRASVCVGRRKLPLALSPPARGVAHPLALRRERLA
jgi:hypothetical protein